MNKSWFSKIRVVVAWGGGGGTPNIKGIKKAVLVPLRVFSLKRSTAGALAVSFRVLSQKIITGDI